MAKTLSSSTSSALSPNWACLPVDLLELILEKLVFLSDYIRFSAVCKLWNSIVLNDHKENRISLSNHQLPWLLVSSRDEDEDKDEDREERFSLYNFVKAEICNFRLGILHNYLNRRYCGSSHGWMIFLSSSDQLVILNPLSGTTIHPPPFNENHRVAKVILSRNPSLGSFEIIATFYGLTEVAYLKFGDEFWIHSEGNNLAFFIYNFIFYKDHIFGVSHRGRIVSLLVTNGDHNGIQSSKESFSRQIKVRFEDIEPHLEKMWASISFIVETTQNDLLLVHIFENFGHSIYKIYKLIVLSNDQFKRIPMVNLDGHCLFLGKNRPISVLASNCPGCRPNSIYYSYGISRRRSGGAYDMYGVEEFNLEDESVRELHRGIGSKYGGSWIVPTMNAQFEVDKSLV
ncbi:putative F-box protein At4g22660 [Ziziphus jujuba]|uniref:F-box protein At4g22660 n=1 Tax=Ziziphus jujuba TaxID=326968 RepID=A0ABM4A3Q4_ZIZJJ|nr:putative F-box protein At4g22660 [Ziziphus jujuba]